MLAEKLSTGINIEKRASGGAAHEIWHVAKGKKRRQTSKAKKQYAYVSGAKRSGVAIDRT